MPEMSKSELEQLIQLLDGRIDELTKPIPSKPLLRFAEAIRSAEPGDFETPGYYTSEDYSNLLEVQNIVSELLPPILENIRAHSIDPETGWRLEKVEAGHGDYGLCAICKKPYQHFGETVKVHHLDMHPGAYHGVCRECVRQYAPLEFSDLVEVETWLKKNRHVCERLEYDNKTEGQRRDLIDAIRTHAAHTHYFGKIVLSAPEWAKGAFGEWR